jgi:hypothetical protein
MNDHHSIPRIIHQIWIGDKAPPPISIMNTWKEKNPSFIYILWNEEEFAKRKMEFICQSKIIKMKEIAGKVDIMRWEILYKYGGVFIDADSICVEPLDEEMFLDGFGVDTDKGYDGFAPFENESCRRGLISNAIMGFVPRHPLCRDIIINILTDPNTDANINTTRAWFSVGPALFTRFLETGKYPTVFKYPSYIFSPHHFTGDKYRGHKKVFGYHEWGSTKASYDNMNDIVLPDELVCPKIPNKNTISTQTPQTPKKPSTQTSEKPSTQTSEKPSTQTSEKPSTQTSEKPSTQTSEKPSTQTSEKPSTQTQMMPSSVEGEWYSVLVCSYNTERRYIRECLDSIANQIGYFGIELVWLNDGSTEQSTAELEFELERFRRTTRFTKVKYEKIERNLGVAMADSLGVFLCSHPLIFRIDSDDIMVPHRMLHQSTYMKSHPDVKILSAGMRMFQDGNKQLYQDVIHPTTTISEFLASPSSWFWNHSACCYYRDTILELGNYNKKIYHRTSYSDYALILRYLKKYGVVHNMPEILVYYRIHPNQTHNDKMRETEHEFVGDILTDILGNMITKYK